MSLIKTRGVILRATNFREADRIVEIYTDELGKLRAVARGVRKIQSRLAGHLEPFTYVDLLLARGRGDLPTIAGAKAREHYAALRRDLRRVATASYLAELVSRLTADGQVSRRLPGLLREALQRLDADHDPATVGSYFEWQMIQTAGWQPELRHCVACQRPVETGQYFSSAVGGVLGDECRDRDPEARPVSREALRLLSHYADRPYLEVEGTWAGTTAQEEARRLITTVVEQTLDRAPKSRAFLAHLEAA